MMSHLNDKKVSKDITVAKHRFRPMKWLVIVVFVFGQFNNFFIQKLLNFRCNQAILLITLCVELLETTLLLFFHDFSGPDGTTVLQTKLCYRVISNIWFSPYYRPCFWWQNYVLGNVSLKTHVFSADVS